MRDERPVMPSLMEIQFGTPLLQVPVLEERHRASRVVSLTTSSPSVSRPHPSSPPPNHPSSSGVSWETYKMQDAHCLFDICLFHSFRMKIRRYRVISMDDFIFDLLYDSDSTEYHRSHTVMFVRHSFTELHVAVGLPIPSDDTIMQHHRHVEWWGHTTSF